jgi:pSer/pThr/pTyr-binding forkhead associated (FHA) protein
LRPSVVEMFDTAMPYVILGRERFALPIGETRIGGTGDDALPFPQLAGVATAAVLLVTPGDAVSLRPHAQGSARVSVNGVPLGTQPIRLTHGAKIETAGLRLVFGDLREVGTTKDVAGVTDGEIALLGLDGPSEPTADSGGRLVVRDSGAVVAIPEGGLVIGRDPECDLVIAGLEVSRRHAVVRSTIQGYVVTDLSTNGIYVNGLRVNDARVLGMGDVIRVGEEELRFEADPATYEPTPELRGERTGPVPVPRPSAEPPTLPQQAAARLLGTLEVITRGVLHGTRFRIERPVVHIGRAPHSDVRLSESTVSASHATLMRRGATWVILDHGSTNGTYVAGERITGERALSGTAELRFGNIKMVFRPIAGGDNADATSTRAAGVPLGQSQRSQKRRR